MDKQVKTIQLRNLLGTMNMPSFRRHDMGETNLRWLLQNIRTSNISHPGLADAMFLIRELLK